MSETTLTINFGQPMPVFPLSGCVLLPQVAAPLHIFEPRYKQMVNDALDSHGLISMAVFEDKPDETEYIEGRPELRPIACVGYVAQYEKLDDGRYLLLLQGVCRAKILDEIDHEPYRMIRLDPIDLEPTDEDDLVNARESIELLLDDPALADLDAVDELRALMEGDIPTEPLIELVTSKLYPDTESMYRVLSTPDARQRAAWLVARMNRTRNNAE